MAGKVKEMVSGAKRRVGAEAPLAADEDGKVGVVRGVLRSFGEGDMDGVIDALTDDVVWENPEGEHFPGAGPETHRPGGDEAGEDELAPALDLCMGSPDQNSLHGQRR